MVSRVTSHAGNAGAGTVIAVDPLHPPPQALALAGQLIREGKLVAFPTETVYGLGANAYDDAAVRRVFAAKGRASDDPLIVHLATTAELEAVAEVPGELRAVVQALAARFWPGPLTVVLPKSARIPPSVTAGLPTVAVRVPSHAVAQGVLRAAGVPIAAPSANTFTRTSATAAAHVVEDLGPRVDLVLDGGPAPIGIESTVIQLAGGEVRLLRPGAVPPEAIDEVLLQQGLPPTRRVSPASQQSDDRDAAGGAEGGPAPSPAGAEGQTAPRGPAASPGLSPKHYAPRARLLYFSGPPAAAREAMLAAAREALTGGRRVGLLLYHEDAPHLAAALAVPTGGQGHQPPAIEDLGPSEAAAEVGRRLFAAMRRLDARGVDVICVRSLPATGLGLAIADRLTRAAGGHIIRCPPPPP